jgi:TorA maturation chaperone TorD
VKSPRQFVRTPAPDDQARANFYGLLSRLFYAPADAELLEALAQADELEADAESLAERWKALCAAAATADPEEVRDEFDTVFIGTGKAPVTLYTTAYSIRYANETPLVALRDDLSRLGLARRDDAGEPEDHIAALCDVMRHLIATQQSDDEEQKRFFQRWIQPNVEPLCAAIEKSERTAFYKHVGRLAKAFFSLEQSAFEML